MIKRCDELADIYCLVLITMILNAAMVISKLHIFLIEQWLNIGFLK
jgi:hypothetical protein